jgi:hypothetical protein
MSELHNADAENPDVVHEESDVNVSAILKYGAALLLAAALAQVFLWWLMGVYGRRHERAQTQVYPMAAGQQDRQPPEPRLQTDPQQDLRNLRTRQEDLLKGYGWVNKEAGVARIPIEDAMKIVVDRGLPAREISK